jgi:hypothetical protein
MRPLALLVRLLGAVLRVCAGLSWLTPDCDIQRGQHAERGENHADRCDQIQIPDTIPTFFEGP